MKVIFAVKQYQDSNKIEYPDDINFFKNTERVGDGHMVADYTGGMSLTPHIAPLPQKTILTPHEFRSRFTFSEKVSIKQSTDAGVQVVQDDLMAAQEIDLENHGLIEGMGYLVGQGLITPARLAGIMDAEVV